MFPPSKTPPFFDLLSPSDQEEYYKLRALVSSESCRHNRHHRLDTFSDVLSSIRSYCERGDSNDGLRALVCGVCHLSDSIAVNVRRLRILVEKCKSSINGSFQRMGFLPFIGKTEALDRLTEKMPQIKGNYNELREWSYRRSEVFTPQPFIPSFNCTEYPVPETPAPGLGSFVMGKPTKETDWPKGADDPFCLKPSCFDDFSWDL
jgi:hypothetical protein